MLQGRDHNRNPDRALRCRCPQLQKIPAQRRASALHFTQGWTNVQSLLLSQSNMSSVAVA